MSDDPLFDEPIFNDPRDIQSVYDRDQFLMAFAVFRDRFSDMSDDQFLQAVMNPIAKGLAGLYT